MNKKIFTITLLSLAMLATACGKEKTMNSPADNITTKNVEENVATPKEEDENITSSFDKELVDELIEDSDYISRVRLQTSTAEGTSSTFLEDYKGDLSKIDINLPKSLSPNQEYIVFFKDDDDGEIVPTNDNAFIEIQDDKDSTLVYIEKIYANSKSSEVKLNARDTNTTTRSNTKTDTTKTRSK